MKRMTNRQLAMAGILIALGLALPFLTGQIPSFGNMLLPMHLPVLLAGFVLGAPLGTLIGFTLPLLRHLLFTMPPLYPTAVAMAFELAAYGFITGFLYRRLPRKPVFIYFNLILAMGGGRLVWGLVSSALYSFSGTPFTWKLFVTAGFVNAVPGLILQIVLIPLLVIALQKAGLIEE
ncbi:MAG: ECF transporter S component [Clostridiaceae bacterium]|jgi:riboflavin transporter FmnP|nr:ECF transporter S component [Clostridiaceae bacterium]